MELTLEEIAEQMDELEILLVNAEHIDPASYNGIIDQLEILDEMYREKSNKIEGDVR